jgi:hypothetical protein
MSFQKTYGAIGRTKRLLHEPGEAMIYNNTAFVFLD